MKLPPKTQTMMVAAAVMGLAMLAMSRDDCVHVCPLIAATPRESSAPEVPGNPSTGRR